MYETAKIAICFHLGYNYMFEEFTKYIDSVLSYDPSSHLYITYQCSEEDLIPIREKYPNAIYLLTLLGCDTGAFLYCANYFLENNLSYRYIFKLHTKKVVPWRIGMLNPISLTPDNVSSIIKKFNKHHRIGMIGVSKYKSGYIGPNSIYLHNIMSKLSTKYDKGKKMRFVAGTIFWIRGKIISKLCKRAQQSGHSIIDYYNQCEKQYPPEPSYTHTWERIFGFIINSFGYKIYWKKKGCENYSYLG